MIRVFNRQRDLKIDKGSAHTLVLSTLRHLNVQGKEIAIYFVTLKAISQLHEQFFNDPTPTDCISIGDLELGEVFVCPAVAIEYAAKHKLDPYNESSLYIVHGLLHLIGYDDLEAKKRRVMRKKEKSCMDWLYEQNQQLRPP